MTKSQWVIYLTDLGIPEQNAKEYASKFLEQQVSIKLLKFITDEDLKETYGVKFGGHRLAIRHTTDSDSSVATTAQTATTQVAGHNSQVRHHPPQLNPNMNTSSFRTFAEHWEVYKKLVGLPSNSVNSAAQIFSLTCTDHPEIRRTIADHRSDHLQLNEDDYIEMLRKLLTARAAPETYRSKLFKMRQSSDETCHQWMKRLKELVPDCEFTIQCEHKPGEFHRFDETILRTQFILGIYNVHIKRDLLTKSSALTTLDDVFNHAVQMETTSRDLQQVTQSIAEVYYEQSTSEEEEEINRISNYKKLQKVQRPKPVRREKPCDGCGTTTQHTSEERQFKCPARKKFCNNCKKRGHFAKVCRAR